MEKVLFTFPNGKQPGGLYNFYGNNFRYEEWRNRTSFRNGIDAFLDYGLVKTEVKAIDGMSIVYNTSVINKDGNVIFNAPKSYDLYVFGKDNTIVQFRYIEGETVVFHDLEGKYLYDYKTASLTSKFGFPDTNDINDTIGRMISNGLIKLLNNRKYGYVNLSGKIVIPIEHETLDNFSEGLVRASDPKNNKFVGYLDKTGKVVIPYEYNNLDYTYYNRDFTNGAAQVCQETCFYINKQGKKVADPNQKKATTSKKQSNKKQSSGKSAAAGAVAGGVVGGIKGGIIGGVIGAIVGD